jgi:hypothetical protein
VAVLPRTDGRGDGREVTRIEAMSGHDGARVSISAKRSHFRIHVKAEGTLPSLFIGRRY